MDKNKNRSGYKKTRNGWIPEEWETTRLDAVAHLQTGMAKGGKRPTDTVEYPYLRVANVQNGYLDLSDIQQIPVHKDRIDRYRLLKNDILLIEGNGNPANLGRCAIWNGEINDCLHQNHIFVVRANAIQIDYRYLAFQIMGARGRYYFISCSKSSSGLATINSTQLKAFPVLLPPLPEQKAIADVLSVWDRAIEKTERLIQAKEKRFKGLLQILINPADKSGWKEARLGDVATIAKSDKLENVEEESLLTVKLHCLGIERNERIQPKLTKKGRPYFKRKAGEFIIGRQNFHNGGFGIIPNELDGLIASNAITSLIVHEGILDVEFLFYTCANPNFYKRIGHIMDGTGQKELSEKQILMLELFLPPLSEQRRIAETLNLAKREIDLLKTLAEKQKVQKRGLMQKLLTGEWRVGTEAWHA